MAAILPLYLSGLYLSRYGGHKDAPSLHDYFDSKEEAIRHYDYLKNVYQSISAKEIYSPYVFPWESAELTRSEIVLKMAYITWMTNDSALKDDLCTCLPSLDTYMRAGYIGVVLNPPTSHLQEEYVLQSLGDRSQDVRDEAYKVLSEMTLSPEQNQKVEELLRFKYSEMRINAINLLMKQPKEQLSGSIRRLLTDKVAERRPGRIGYDEDYSQRRISARYLSGTDPYRQRNSETERERKSVDRISDWRRNERKHRTALYQKITASVCTTRLLKSICRRLPRDKGFNVKKHSNSFASEGLNLYLKTKQIHRNL